MAYPKWVYRAHDIGPVLCQSAVEEEQLLLDWVRQQESKIKDGRDEIVPWLQTVEVKRKK